MYSLSRLAFGARLPPPGGTEFDAYPWRHPVTEYSYINRLANRPSRSTVKTLPELLAAIRGQRTAIQGSRFKLCGSRLVDAEPVTIGVFVGYGSNWAEGWGVGSGFREVILEKSLQLDLAWAN